MKELKRLRIKFILTNMSIVTVILLAMCVTMLTVTRDNLRRQSVECLRKAAQEGYAYSWPGLGERKRNDINLPYFSVMVELDGSVTVTADRFGALEDVDQLKRIIADCMSQPEPMGELTAYRLRYLRSEGLLEWNITFVDSSQEHRTLQDLASVLLLIGGVTLGAFFFLSLRLARWATRPVEESWKRQRQFVSDASHELKTPLTVILSNADLLEGNGGEEQKRRWLENIRAASGQMSELVEGLLTLARFDGQVSAPAHQQVDLSELAEEEVLLFEPVLFEAGKGLEESIQEGVLVQGDPAKLRRLMDILLDNARKYADPGSVVTVKLSCEGKKRVRLSVNTKGAVIPPERLERLFERFYREEQSRTSEGYGLGLSIARQIAEEHQGRIWAESSEEEGNTFIVMIGNRH